METTNEIVKLFRERLKYPIITVYCIVLIVYNWDVLGVFFLSNKGIEERIIYINTVFKGQSWSRVLWPLAKALFLSIFAPLLMLGLDLALKQINTKRQKIRDEKNVHSLNKKLEVANLEFQIEEAKNGKKTIEEMNDKIIKFENESKQLKETINIKSKELDNVKQSLAFSDEIMNSVTTTVMDNLQNYLSENQILKLLQFFVSNHREKITHALLSNHLKHSFRLYRHTELDEENYTNIVNILINEYIIVDLLNEFVIGSIGKVMIHDLVNKNKLKYEENHG